jgi:predicted metalloprotease
MWQRHRYRSHPSINVALRAIACSVLLLSAGCSPTVLDGRARSMLYDPFRVAGLPAVDGPSGPRGPLAAPSRPVINTDGGPFDRLAALAVTDIEFFWTKNYSTALPGQFTPVSRLRSYDSNDRSGALICGENTFHQANAFFCPTEDVIAWDRGTALPIAKKYFGDMAVAGVLAHEYGHAIQQMARLDSKATPTLVLEQQADCFAGVYLRWVAEGHSERFTLSTTDGLNHVLAGLIFIRDPRLAPSDAGMVKMGHGTAVDRIGAFQIGFDEGTASCAAIDMKEIKQRRGDLPLVLEYDNDGDLQTGEIPINSNTLSTLMELMGQIFSPRNPPTLTANRGCSPEQQPKPAAYCPASNTVAVDLAALQKMGAAADENKTVLLQGDNTALSVVTSRYTLAVQHERGLPLDSPQTAMRTACLTGVVQRKMAEPIALPSGRRLVLAAGDVDQAVAGLLSNGMVASDVNGSTVPAGFTRIFAYRIGLEGDADQCYQRFS